MTSVRILLKGRAHFKSRITKSLSYATSNAGTATKEVIVMQIEHLQQTWKDFQHNREAIYAFEDADGYVDPDLDFDIYEDKYFRALEIYKTALNARQSTEPASEGSEGMATVLREVAAMASAREGGRRDDDDLPKISIGTFSGCYKEWPTFFDSFVKAIHERPQLSGVQKFKYLRSVLRGDAAAIIANITASDANYPTAWERLKMRYDRPQLVVNSFIDTFFKLPSSSTASPIALRKLSDGANGIIRGLDAIGRTDRDAWLIYLLVQKLDPDTSQEWAKTSMDLATPTVEQFFQFLDSRCDRLELYTHKTSGRIVAKTGSAKAMVATTNPGAAGFGTCPKCQGDHMIWKCQLFTALSQNDRRLFVKNHSLCFNCLRSGHMGNKCRSQARCRECRGRHHVLVHPEHTQGGGPFTDVQPTGTRTTSTTLSSRSNDLGNATQCAQINVSSKICPSLSQALIPTAVVDVLDARGQLQQCRLILDSGSQVSLVTETLVNRIGLPRRNGRITIAGISSSRAGTTNGICDLQIRSRVSSELIHVPAFILPRLTASLPCTTFDIGSSFASLQLADPFFNVAAPIDVLLGSDQFWTVVTEEGLFDQFNNKIGQSSIFGWLITSSLPTVPQASTSLAALVDIDTTLRQFWEIEEVPHVFKPLEEHIAVERAFVTTTSRAVDGKYIVCLPFRKEEPIFQDTLSGALARFKSVERRLAKDETLRKKYTQFMREYEQLNHMREVPPERIKVDNGKIYYLPHHPVLGVKLRVVFDGSFRDAAGVSLNDHLCIGPPIQRDLFSVCLRFRMHRLVFSADIVKMFRQIWVAEHHRNYQRILWRETPKDEIKHFQLNTVTYGTSCAPFLSVRTLRQLALDHQTTYPIGAKILLNDFYVDDVLTGANNYKDLVDIKCELIKLLSLAGLELRKWVTNSPNLVNDDSRDEVNMQSILEGETEASAKVLGLAWRPEKDVLLYNIRLRNEQRPTKRVVLSDVARIFDPLGLLSPVVVQFKILFQQLWLQNLSWDDDLPDLIANRWSEYRRDLDMLTHLHIPRYIPNAAGGIELHGFCDASLKAYAATIYCRSNDGKNIHTSLVTAKTRVSPLKQISLPRLELCGALLLTRLLIAVKEALQQEPLETWAWTDSEIVLAWLSSPPCQLGTFVGNRTAEILETIPRNKWNYVPSKENPADCASRGLPARELLNFDLYWHGPVWLRQVKYERKRKPQSNISQVMQLPEVRKEMRRQVITLEAHITADSDLENVVNNLLLRCSDWWKLVKVTAFVWRFVTNCRSAGKSSLHGPLALLELSAAKQFLFRLAQQEFRPELDSLRRRVPLGHSSKLNMLAPFISDDGLLRVGGRLGNADQLSYSAQHPIILPKNHRVTYLILMDEHVRNLHPGVSALFVILRQRYWIFGARTLIRKIVHECMKCFRQRQLTSQQLMANLPSVRVQQAYPFSKTGCDYAGPITLKLHPGRTTRKSKGYICLFVCLVTKAIHLELASDLSTETFLAALRRFLSRRGPCSSLYTDNGTNFKGAHRTLNEMYQQLTSRQHNEAVTQALAKDGIQWHFIPPLAPHFGGIWESGVRVVKQHLKRVIGNAILTFEQMHTLLAQTEAIINSRPLCAMSDDHLEALTPAHFLIGRPYTALPEQNLLGIPSNRLKYWTLIQNMVQGFWKRWHREYLTSLQHRPKWQQAAENFKPGDMVVVKSPHMPPAKWDMGRIIEVHPGADNLVRVVRIRTQRGEVTRAIGQVVRLPTC